MLSLLPLVRGGTVRAVAVTGRKRSALAPEIPTMAELGLPELDFGAWWATWGPPGMAAGLVNTLNGWVNEAVKALAADGRLDALGIEPAAKTPEEFTQYLHADLDRSAKLLKAANFVPQ
jgi:tripartite-type tricarboxylate transporter receptor subunit TctC